MTIVSFYAEKVRRLARLSIDNPDLRRADAAQRFSGEFLRDDLTPERRANIEASRNGTLLLDVTHEDIDVTKVPAGVWLTDHDGVRISPNIVPDANRFPDPFEFHTECFETDLRNNTPGQRTVELARIARYGLPVTFIPAETVLNATWGRFPIDAREVIMLDVTPHSVRLPEDMARKSWASVMRRSGIRSFFDPDRKAPPRLFDPNREERL